MAKAPNLNDAFKSINDKLGYDALLTCSDELKCVIKGYVSSGNSLMNKILSGKSDGGFPLGRVVEIYSEASIGKTTFALQALINVQKMGGIGIIIDTESTVDLERAKAMGLNTSPDKFRYVGVDTVEKVFEIIEATLNYFNAQKEKTPIVIMWDSIAATSAKTEMENDFGGQNYPIQARVISQGFRKTATLISSSNACIICINQAKHSIGGMVPQITTFGGDAVEFYASIRLFLKKGTPIKEGDRLIGHQAIVKTTKNKIFVPLLTLDVPLLFQSGINEEYSWFNFLVAQKVIVQAGAWYKLTIDKKELSFRSADWIKMCLEDAELRAFCLAQVDKFNIITGKFD